MIGLHLGLLVLAASVFRLVPLTLNTLAWLRLLPPAGRCSFRVALVLRWIGEAVNSVIPWAQAGGDLVRARLLSRRGVPAPQATAVLIVDLAIGFFTQVLYAGVGLAAGAARGAWASRRHLLGLGAITGGAVILVALGPLLTRALATGAGARRWPRLARRLEEFHAAFRTLALDHRSLGACTAWHLGAWVSQAGETWLVLTASGVPVTLADALWVDSLSAAARTLAFFVPAGLGAQEVALLTLGRSLGIEAAPLVTLMVVKRLREVAMGGLGLGAWALLRRASPAERSS